MTADSDKIAISDYEKFRTFLQQTCGIVLGDNKQYLVVSRLKKIQDEIGASSLGQLLERLQRDAAGSLRAKVVDAMTTNETYWFRDVQPYEMLQDSIVPELLKTKRKKLRIWSAACSSGQEPYSISMALMEYFSVRGRTPVDVEIVATDVSPTMLKIATAGAYDELSLSRGLSDERRKRFFVQDGKLWRVKPEVRVPIKFQELNLMNGFGMLGKFDAIFCRNVLIYFNSDLKRDILNRMVAQLSPDGYLFLGGSESMASYSAAFETVRYKSGLAFRLKSR